MITVKLGMENGLLVQVDFTGSYRQDIANIYSEFGGSVFSPNSQGFTIDSEYFKAFNPRVDDEKPDTLAFNMNDLEASRLINWLRDNGLYLVDATEDVMAAWTQGKPVDVTPEKLVYDW